MTESTSFDDLIRSARAGDAESLGHIWEMLNPRVVAYLAARTSGDAEDLASETWIGVAGALDRFAGNQQRFEAFVFTIARRRLIDKRRADGRRPVQPTTAEALDRISPSGNTESDALEQLEERELIELVKRELPTAQAEVFFLRVVAGLDVAQTAEVLGKRPGTVRVLQHRALAKLSAVLPDREVTL